MAEREIVPLVNGWRPSPYDRLVAGQACYVCRDAIQVGSSFYCPRCHKSGYDHLLMLQTAIVGFPPLPQKASPATLKKARVVAAQVAKKAAVNLAVLRKTRAWGRPATGQNKPTRRERRAARPPRPEEPS